MKHAATAGVIVAGQHPAKRPGEDWNSVVISVLP